MFNLNQYNLLPIDFKGFSVDFKLINYFQLVFLVFTSARVHFSACEGSIPSLRSYQASQFTSSAMAPKFSQEQRQVFLQAIEDYGLSAKEVVDYLKLNPKDASQKGGKAERGLRVGSGGVGLVPSLLMVLDLCSALFRNA